MANITASPRPRRTRRGDHERLHADGLLVAVVMRRGRIGLAMIFGVAAITIIAAFAVHASRSAPPPDDVDLEANLQTLLGEK
jgi:hypothetical protein